MLKESRAIGIAGYTRMTDPEKKQWKDDTGRRSCRRGRAWLIQRGDTDVTLYAIAQGNGRISWRVSVFFMSNDNAIGAFVNGELGENLSRRPCDSFCREEIARLIDIMRRNQRTTERHDVCAA